MSLTYSQVKEFVHEAISIRRMKHILRYVYNHEPNYWGSDKKERFFIETMVYVTLYKDIYGLGIHKLHSRCSFLNIYESTLRHNIKETREKLGNWGQKQIEIGSVFEWNRNMRKLKLGNEISDANLFIDSSDFSLAGKSTTSTKSMYWSFKNNGPAQRYTIIYDGKGLIRRVYGGNSPKTYDSTLLKIMREYFANEFYGARIIGDNHFHKANEYFSNIKFYCNTPKKGEKRKRDGTTRDTTPEKEKTWNKQIKEARGKVESPFGILKNKFKSLQLFYEGEQQQDNLVFFGFGLLTAYKH